MHRAQPAAAAFAAAALGLLTFALAVLRLADRPLFLPGMSLGDSEVLDLAVPGSFPRAIVDPAGREVVLTEPPSAIVSVILGGDEILARLVDPSRVRGVTYLVDDPGISNAAGAYAREIPRNRGDIEEVIAAEPDLVVLAAFTNAVTAGMLLDAGIALLRFAHFDTHEDIRRNVRSLARAVGEDARGEAWIHEMDQRIEAVRRRVSGRPRPRVLYYGVSGSTAGPGSLMDETIVLAGGDNVIAGTGLGPLPRISPELAIALQPEVILLNGWSAGRADSTRELLLSNPAWRKVPAVRDDRVYSLSGAWITAVSPHRVRGIEEVSRLLHPSAFAGTAAP